MRPKKAIIALLCDFDQILSLVSVEIVVFRQALPSPQCK